jgi:hypothetical protein
MKQENKSYEAPKIVTYTEDEILELIGPAQTVGSANSVNVFMPPAFPGGRGKGHGKGH